MLDPGGGKGLTSLIWAKETTAKVHPCFLGIYTNLKSIHKLKKPVFMQSGFLIVIFPFSPFFSMHAARLKYLSIPSVWQSLSNSILPA